MYTIFASRSKSDAKWFERNCAKDKFLTPSETVALGLADDIIIKYQQE
jgi:ATP-dependent protease ClpP protease subunit